MKNKFGQGLRFLLFISFIILIVTNCKKNDDPELHTDEWTEDIDYFATELPLRHKNLFHNITEQEFNEDIKNLKKDITELEDYEILIELMKIIAKIGDSHTNINTDYSKYFSGFPIKIQIFDDGSYITQGSSNYENYFKKKITKIGNYPIDTVFEQIGTLIPHENVNQLKNMAPNYITICEVLYKLNISININSANFKFENSETVEIANSGNSNTWLSIYDDFEIPLSMQNTDSYYWYTFMNDSSIVYVQYNKCSNKDGYPFLTFNNELFSEIGSKSIDKFIIDLRYNGGGNSSVFRPMIDSIINKPEINKNGALFVCIGRRTFSSAIINSIQLKGETNATLIGEPTGGAPNSYGEVKYFELPNSKLEIWYSTKYFKLLEGDGNTLEPEIRISVNSNDVFAGKDPVIDYILNLD